MISDYPDAMIEFKLYFVYLIYKLIWLFNAAIACGVSLCI